MLLFGICKDPLNGFLTDLVHPLADRCTAGLFCHFHIITPDVLGNCLNVVFVLCAKMSCRAVTTDLWITFVLPITVTVCRAVFQYMVLRTQYAIIILVIYILLPFVSAFHCLGTRIGCEKNLTIPVYQFTDVRGLVGAVGHERMDTVEFFGDSLIQIVKRNTVMDIAGGYFYIQNHTVCITGGVGFIRQLPFVVTFY